MFAKFSANAFSSNAKKVGMYYFWSGLFSGVVGFQLSYLIRISLKHSGLVLLVSPGLYHTVLTAHALVMIFFAVMPILIGSFGNLLLPLFLSKSDMDMPRWNSFSFWVTLGALSCLLSSAFMGSGASTSWTVYPPLSSKTFHSSFAVDFAIFSLHLAGVSSLVASLNFVMTSLSFKNFNNSLLNTSLFVWCLVVTSLLLILSLPVLAGGITMLLLERNLSSGYFDASVGGNPVLFQHLFWFFGHPEVYILILPAFGAVSSASLVLSGEDSIFGYVGMVYAILSIGVLGSIVWGHHMFATSLDLDTKFYFMAATSVISVPTGMKIFTWLTTMSKSPKSGSWEPLASWTLGFVLMFMLGGLSGVFLSNSSLDKVFHDTYYVVAHFHLVLSMGAMFGILVAVYLWVPLFSGASFSWSFSCSTFLVIFTSVNLIFVPMHLMGLMGYVRKSVDSPVEVSGLSYMASQGSTLSFFGVVFFVFSLYDMFVSLRLVSSFGGKTVEFLQGSSNEHTNTDSPSVFLCF